ncbi:histidinol-phosphate transaminase [Azotosporobacter soli]|uniref:histidinol-phosphate transaminase n=1 Tax=Azotosporobacter soli TaxID=3055040 RepID=UPI0031FE7E3E
MFDYCPNLEKLKPYSVDEADWDIKLDANESPCNLPPLVRERILERMDYLAFNRYPDIEGRDLRVALAEGLGLTWQQVAIGNGSSELLLALCQLFGGPGRSIAFPTPSFSMYGIYAQVTGSKALSIPLALEEVFDRDAVVAAVRKEDAKLLLLCNPNNPTGAVIDQEDIEYILTQVSCPVVVDEAYYEFYGKSSIKLLGEYENLIITRTFSKAYGLAATRAGYLMGNPEVVRLLEKVLMPYHVNAITQIAAETVWLMRDQFEATIRQIVVERKRMADALKELPGIEVYPSQTNFLLLKVAAHKICLENLAAAQIAVRAMGTGVLTNCLRVTVGTPIENDAFLTAMRKIAGGQL